MGVESNAQQNLENLSKSILEFSSEIQVDTIFTSFQAALEYLFLASQKERLLLVIDEYPYVARSSKSLASSLRLFYVLYRGSCISLQGPSLWQVDSPDENPSF